MRIAKKKKPELRTAFNELVLNVEPQYLTSQPFPARSATDATTAFRRR